MVLSRVRQTVEYTIVKELHSDKGYPIRKLCQLVGVSRAAYYKWLGRDKSQLELENEALLFRMKELQKQYHGILGCERMTMYVNRESEKRYNHKRVHRVMRYVGMKSIIRRKRPHYVRSTPQITAENLLNREFQAERSNEKWLTDVTEFKYGSGQKAYLSAILDLADKRIVSYKFGRSNNNHLVFETLEAALASSPGATPLFHSDRGFQYTSRVFRSKLDAAGMTQSMSRVSRCIDNGPMEGFWGTLKAEMYYLRRFHTFEELEGAIDEYIRFYNQDRLQKRLCALSPMEYHRMLL